MADAVQQPVRYEDVSQLRSRISWGAIFAGMVTALACSLILTLFFAGIGLSLTASDVRANALEIGALVAAVVTIIASMFVGGWVTTQLTAGETHREAVIHGVLCWAAVTGVSVCMAVSGMRATGYFALVGGAVVAQNPNVAANWEEAARANGIPQARIEQWRADLRNANIQATVSDPANQEQARRAAIVTAWATLIGVLLSMGAAVGGAVAGCGPNFRLFPVATHERREILIAR